MEDHTKEESELTRRQLLKVTLAGGIIAASGLSFANWMERPRLTASTFIGKAESYDIDLSNVIESGLRELGVTPAMMKGKRILLKPNLVETYVESAHINTHPLVVRGGC